MRQSLSILKNEDGAVVIIAALMILGLLTIIGVASVSTSGTEVRIAGYESSYQQNFYNAEGATVETVELMEGIANPKTTRPAWLEEGINAVSEDDIFSAAFWENGTCIGTCIGTCDVTPEASSTLNDTQFLALSHGPMSGGSGTSLAMGSSKVYRFTIYGRAAPPRRGETIIKIGYLKAF